MPLAARLLAFVVLAAGAQPAGTPLQRFLARGEEPTVEYRATSSANLRGARGAVALLLAINLFNYIDRQVLAAVESKIGNDLLGNDPHALAKTGSLASAFLVSYMIAAPIFGWLADRMSRWLLVGAGVAWILTPVNTGARVRPGMTHEEVSAIVAGLRISPCPAHSAAMASARAWLGSASGALAGVFRRRLSRKTRKPPSAGRTVASL